ncbi:hypothetical protein BCR33DRAFT_344318 [Rhizoclosmatium globosum]|uniref:P-loop containing nucleoside triphosphate hydrolase protein n=1 Tax=Rhizoclosmatium globosum TaxID=329046 RepID=A0A1Y2C361_9FUNG|nr:hypothetical protein BCR33DRAFT_344318 [Rhizoclosmatium globosum]|eukprot:ORY41324.1 hypothetical protein BCR33DRAFT_344318 [Rhizoclosmatium globosum]
MDWTYDNSFQELYRNNANAVFELMCFGNKEELASEEIRQTKLVDLKIPSTVHVAPCAQLVAPFMLPLYPYQLRTLAWMQNVEDSVTQETYYHPGIVQLDERAWFVHQKTTIENVQYTTRRETTFSVYGECMTFDEVSKRFPSVRSGIIADKPGVGKTITTLALCHSRRFPANVPYLYTMKNSRFRSKATAIFVPNNICSQWMAEIKRCFGTSIKVIELKGKKNYVLTTLKEVLECDIVVVSYNFLVNGAYVAHKAQDRLLQSATQLDFTNPATTRAFIDQNTAGDFAFTWIHFHRIVCDEFHEISEKSCGIRGTLLALSADRIWGLTGTPKLDRPEVVAKFAAFLQLQLTSKLKSENFGSAEDEFDSKAFILARIRRNEPEVQYPPPIYETIRVVPTAVEMALYRSSTDRRANVENLVKLCNHYQIANGVADGSEGLSIDMVTERVQRVRINAISTLTDRIRMHDVDVRKYRKAAEEASGPVAKDYAIQRYYHEKKVNDELRKDLVSLQSQFTFFENFLATYLSGEVAMNCSVCLEDSIPRDNLGLLPCGHVFCYDCAADVAAAHKKCPQCRTDVTLQDVMKLNPPAEVIQAPEGVTIDSENGTLDPDKFGSKIRELVKYLQREMEASAANRFIVFIQFSDLADLVSKALNTFGIHTARLGGGWPQRENAVKKFRAGLPGVPSSSGVKPVKVLMLSAHDSVSGLNLTEATHCIILHPFHDRTEEYAVGAEKQGVARTLRNGQTKRVKIVRFIVENTVEEQMHNRRVNILTLNDVV